MPRKPFREQRRYDLTTRTRNCSRTDARRGLQAIGGWTERYFVGKYIGVVRASDFQPLIHNGKKAR